MPFGIFERPRQYLARCQKPRFEKIHDTFRAIQVADKQILEIVFGIGIGNRANCGL